MRLFNQNKKAWIRIAEAAIAIMLLSSFLILLISRQAEESKIGESIYRLQSIVLQEAAKNDSVRNAVLSGDKMMIEDFIGQRMPLGIDFNITICNAYGECPVPTTTVNKELYVADTIISSTLTQYEPKRLKIASWISGGETVRKRYGGVNAVASYYFEEDMGKVVRDSSGNSFNGWVIGEENWTAGKIGRGYKFNGSSYINLSGLSEIRDSITLEAWIYPTELTNGDTIIIKPHDSDDNKRLYALFIGNQQTLKFQVTINDNPYFIETDKNILKTDQWQYVAGTYEGKQLKLYVNGVEMKSAPISGRIDTNNMPVWIGRGRISAFANGFKGVIDNVRINNKALTQTEILKNYQEN
jgi:hypothetical protein